MGYSIAWLAAQGKPPQSLLAEIDLRPTGKAGEFADHPVVGAALEDGWYLLVAQGCDHRMISDRVLKTLSRGCRVIACSVEEHVMFSAAWLWEDGKCVWSVSHQGDEKTHDLSADGVLPEFFAGVRDELLARQAAEGGEDAEVDYVFEIPLELARRISGFKHDSSASAAIDHFEVLDPAPAKPWWKPW
jgi:Family of unknown function (DUF6461)